ncbi:potassium-transporting ATPase subunit F [Legionella saoudiensis]
MITYLIAGIIAVVLLAYLLLVLFKPEFF